MSGNVTSNNPPFIDWQVWFKTVLKSHCLGFGDTQDFSFLDPDPDPDPRGKISTKNCKKKSFLTPKTQIWTFEKRDYKNFLISEWLIKFKNKNKRQKF